MPLYNDLPGPEAGSVFAFKVQTTHTVFAIPATWTDRMVGLTVRAPGLNSLGQPACVWIAFGTSASAQVSRTDFVTGTPPAFTIDVNTGLPICDGKTVDWKIRSTWTHFSVQTDLVDTELYITPSQYQKHETQAG